LPPCSGHAHHCTWNIWRCGISSRSTSGRCCDRASVRPIGCSGRGCLVCGQTGKASRRSFSRMQKTNRQWVWIAMDRQTRHIIAFHVGNRSRDSATQLWANLPEVDRTQATFYTDQYEAYKMKPTRACFQLSSTKRSRKKLVKPITLSGSITPYDSAPLGWCVTRSPSPKSWPIRSVPSRISSAITTLPGLQHYLYNTTRSSHRVARASADRR
jgi:IS1 family transposase